MNDTAIIALLTFLGGGTVTAVVAAVFTRRETAAKADLTVGEAWGRFVETQSKVAAEQLAELTALRRDNSELRGELRAARESIAQLERRERESMVWQAQVTTREEDTRARLARQGIDIPPMPDPPATRIVNTRAEDNQRGARP